MAQGNFKPCVDFIIDVQEGVTLTHDPNDPGGTTKFGISQRAHPNVDIENLTREQAEQIYLTDYWQRLNLDAAPVPLDLAIFDAAVNNGVNFAYTLSILHTSWEDTILFRMNKYWDMAFANKVTREKWFFGWIGRLTRLYTQCKTVQGD